MFRFATLVALQIALLSVSLANQLGQPSMALRTKPRPCSRGAVAAVKEDKAKALDMFSKGEGGFKDRDLYVWCAELGRHRNGNALLE